MIANFYKTALQLFDILMISICEKIPEKKKYNNYNI